MRRFMSVTDGKSAMREGKEGEKDRRRQTEKSKGYQGILFWPSFKWKGSGIMGRGVDSGTTLRLFARGRCNALQVRVEHLLVQSLAGRYLTSS